MALRWRNDERRRAEVVLQAQCRTIGAVWSRLVLSPCAGDRPSPQGVWRQRRHWRVPRLLVAPAAAIAPWVATP